MKHNDKIIFALSVLAFGLLIYGIFPQIGLTYDSRLYLNLANSLFTDGFSQRSFGSKPPLFPIVLNLLQSNFIAIALANIACWGFSMYLLLKTFNSQFEDQFYKICFTAVLLFSTPIILVHNFVWTEPYYLVLISLIFAIQSRDDFPRKTVFLALLFLLLVSLKHLGASVVFIFGLLAFIKDPRDWKKWVLTYAPAFLFFLLWQFKSFTIRGDFSRLDHFEESSLSKNLDSVGQVFVHWVFPFPVPVFISITAALLVLVISVIALIRSNGILRYSHGFTLMLILVLATKGDLIPDDTERYLAISFPIYAFLGFLFVSERKFSNSYIIKSGALLIVAYTIFRTVKNCLQWHEIF